VLCSLLTGTVFDGRTIYLNLGNRRATSFAFGGVSRPATGTISPHRRGSLNLRSNYGVDNSGVVGSRFVGFARREDPVGFYARRYAGSRVSIRPTSYSHSTLTFRH
jgi:hypothetical protein